MAVPAVVRVLLHSTTGGKHWVAVAAGPRQGAKCLWLEKFSLSQISRMGFYFDFFF